MAVDETFTPGEAEYSALVSKMQAAGVDVFFLGGLHRETGLIFRQAPTEAMIYGWLLPARPRPTAFR